MATKIIIPIEGAVYLRSAGMEKWADMSTPVLGVRFFWRGMAVSPLGPCLTGPTKPAVGICFLVIEAILAHAMVEEFLEGHFMDGLYNRFNCAPACG